MSDDSETYVIDKDKLIKASGTDRIISDLYYHVVPPREFDECKNQYPPTFPDIFYVKIGLPTDDNPDGLKYYKTVDSLENDFPFIQMDTTEIGYTFLVALFRTIGTKV